MASISPIMVKNPLNPDINIWIGALERLNQAGIRKLIAVHRGFSFFTHTPYRNSPMWEIPIELKRLYPELACPGRPQPHLRRDQFAVSCITKST